MGPEQHRRVRRRYARALQAPHFGDDTDRLIALYGLDDPQRAEKGAVAMLDDDLIGIHHRFLGARHAARNLPAYLYFFTREPPSRKQTLGAHHGAEIPFVFGSHDGLFFVADEPDWALTDAMIGYWTNFARTGDPNGAGLPLWPRYDSSDDAWLVLDHEIQGSRDPGESRSSSGQAGHSGARSSAKARRAAPKRRLSPWISRLR